MNTSRRQFASSEHLLLAFTPNGAALRRPHSNYTRSDQHSSRRRGGGGAYVNDAGSVHHAAGALRGQSVTSNNERSGRIKRLREVIEEKLKAMWVYMIKMIKMIKQALFNTEGLSLKIKRH